MNPFHPKLFFDLSDYEHAVIFDGVENVWEALNKIKEYLASLELGIIEVKIPDGVILINPELISIGKNTHVEPGAFIQGPCVIGDNSIIRQGAYIRGNLIAGKQTVIGHATEIKNSIFLDFAQAPHFAYVGDSILGNHVNLGAGTKLANLRFDNQPVSIELDDRKVETGLRKFGAVFGDFSQSGCNTVTNPGTIFGKKACCFPCMNVGGFIPEGKLVRRDGSTVAMMTQ